MLIALLALFSLLIAYVLHHVLSHQTLLLQRIFAQTIYNTLQLARLIGPLDPYDPLAVPDPIPDSNSASKISEAEALAAQRIDYARSIVDFSYAGPKVELEDRLRLRALANSRLVAAFGINTSLTSSSVSVHKKFRKLASASINKSRADWQKLYGVCMDFLQCEKARYGRTGIGLAECVRCLCFVVVLVSQFGADDKKVDKNLVKRITDEINAQWLKSKEDGGAVKTSDSLNHDLGMLFGTLKTSVAEENGTGKDTSIDPSEALGLIMPQYETLWRVVLLTYVTAYYTQFDKRSLKKRVKDIPYCLGNADLPMFQEGLRLYPSNNSIYRAATGPGPLKSADVQACHRDFNVWGRDALEFRPERFDNLTPLQEKAYFPFSLGSHKCPAFGGFGNRMVTMLVVSMGRALSPEAGKLNFKDAQLDNHVGINLPTGRDEMENWSWDMVRLQ
ncbi:uncharacterized protein B0T23DRAFT_382767 [Neurospora hispaniola]|uniref:Cytochrome P450 n=1 Tax=Neurospora hispaniola TaxID=588809 RepID=A0AAJ0I644_9PEZI|nr:hypothetical protein B0T23DRAFT_382767 [Neurospora hispaniola]